MTDAEKLVEQFKAERDTVINPIPRNDMKRDPHSKFTFAITEFKLQATWNDGVVEDLTRSLPESLLAEIEQYLTDMDDLRTQDPESYGEFL